MSKYGQCVDCGCDLERSEKKYYGYRCEPCEREALQHVEDWRLGRVQDAELDKKFAGPVSRLH